MRDLILQLSKSSIYSTKPSKGKDLYAYSRYGDKDLVKYVDVGMTYYFNKNMSTYVDYKINLLDEDDRFYKNSGIATDDIVALGLVYQF